MAHGRALLVGLIRNSEVDFEINFKKLMSAMSVFETTDVYIVESDSSDGTVSVLERISKNNPYFRYKSFGRIRDRLPNRLDRLVYCRNEYLRYFFKKRDRFDYLVVADLDGVNDGVTAESLESCWSTDCDWDAAFANQQELYYDIFALRHWCWCPGDCWSNYRFLKGLGLSDDRAVWDAVYSKMVNIPVDHDWIKVDSAFGGLGIYKAHKFPEERYSCYDVNGNEICDHVGLHLSEGFRGKRLYINPRLINGGLNGHSKKALLRNRVKVKLQRIERKYRKLRDNMGLNFRFSNVKNFLKSIFKIQN